MMGLLNFANCSVRLITFCALGSQNICFAYVQVGFSVKIIKKILM